MSFSNQAREKGALLADYFPLVNLALAAAVHKQAQNRYREALEWNKPNFFVHEEAENAAYTHLRRTLAGSAAGAVGFAVGLLFSRIDPQTAHWLEGGSALVAGLYGRTDRIAAAVKKGWEHLPFRHAHAVEIPAPGQPLKQQAH